jgi:WD40 repeat protein
MTSLQIIDAMTGSVVAEMEGLCRWDLATAAPRIEAGHCNPFPETPFGLYNVVLEFSPNGQYLAAVDHEGYEGYVAIWNAATGELVHAADLPSAVWGAVFSPDSRELIVSTVDGELIAISTEGWQVVRRRMIDESVDERGRLGFAGFLADRTTLVGMSGFGSTGGGTLHRIDLSTLAVQSSNRAHDGAPKSLAISPDGTLVASGAADGQVRVWEGATGALLHEFTVAGQAQGVAFVGNDRLAVTPQAGGVLIMALDSEDLLEVVRGSLTRGLTAEECARFNFGVSCPSDQSILTP